MIVENPNKEQLRRLKRFELNDIDLEQALLIRYKPYEFIIRQGQYMQYLLFVLEGEAKATISASNGKDLLLAYCCKNDIIGDLELMINVYKANTSIMALTDYVCIGLPFAKFANQLKNNVAFLNLIGKGISEKLLESSRNNKSTVLYSAEERLCECILRMSKDNVFSEKLTDVAKLIGISYRHIHRLLKKLCSDGIIEKYNNKYRILNTIELNRKTFEIRNDHNDG